ncbi:MAG: winged helix-turn-helix transcriptional regulator [Cellulomonas sp.]
MVTTSTDTVVAELTGDPYRRDCPTRYILDRIGDKWSVLIVGALGPDALRFSELMRRVDGISQKMLTQTLRALEHDGLVVRRAYPEVPVRVEYQLTASGLSLREPLRALEEWSIQHLVDVLAARAVSP